MRVSSVNFRLSAQNSPAHKGFFKLKPHFPDCLFYTPVKDEKFQEGATAEQRELFEQYYCFKHPSAFKMPKVKYYIEYPLQATTLELEKAYWRGQIKHYPQSVQDAVDAEITGLLKDGWIWCTPDGVDAQVKKENAQAIGSGIYTEQELHDLQR